MTTRDSCRRRVAAIAWAGAVAFAFAVAVPHVHDTASKASHPAQSCRACKIQEGFSASPVSAVTLDVPRARIVGEPVLPQTIPHVVLVAHHAPSRAPPPRA